MAEGRSQNLLRSAHRAPPSNYHRRAVDLKAIYLTTLERCAPEKLVRPLVTSDMPRNVVAIGKCAGALFDGVAAVHDIESAFVAVPDRYKLPDGGAAAERSEEHTSELQSHSFISYAVFCLKK